ncbi:MAG TPA: hypothetical protein PLG75_07095 [Methanoculleus sp.]|nr:hypothetical protein [Methanoculleus sp.]
MLCRAIVGNLARNAGVLPGDICIVLHEPSAENQAEHGETFALSR